MSEPKHPEMEKDHDRWHSEHAIWLEDVLRWQRDYREALATVGDDVLAFVAPILDSSADLVAHCQTIFSHQQALASKPSQGDADEMAETHQQIAAAHADQRRAHEQFRQRHENVMKRLALLKEALQEESSGSAEQ